MKWFQPFLKLLAGWLFLFALFTLDGLSSCHSSEYFSFNEKFMDKNQIKLFSSKKTDDWATPEWLYRELNNEFHFTLDPCPIEPVEDGLTITWYGNIFVNPPYSQVKK